MEDKYYKGYRYEKTKYGSEFWYDENDKIRKAITYHYNGNKSYESYFNEKGDYHNNEGYSNIEWNINGEITIKEYYLNDVKLTEQEWKEKTGKVESPQLDYLNPQSEKYYKGFRYEKDKCGDEFWYDENNLIRKLIAYYDNGNKSYECYCNEKDEYHNEESYAFQKWNINGEVRYQEYYLYDVKLTEDEWKQEVNNIKTKAKSIRFGYLDHESEDYYKGFKKEENSSGDPRIYWYDENNVCRKRILYHKNGNKYLEQYYNEEGVLHNEDIPAVTKWNDDGRIAFQKYYLNNIEIHPKIFNYIKSLKNEINDLKSNL